MVDFQPFVQLTLNFKLSTDKEEIECVNRLVLAAEGDVPIKFVDRKA